MIETRDVVRLYMPFPDITSDLAVKLHMYICRESHDDSYVYLKCQSLKPSMIGDPRFVYYVDEDANSTRNPFRHTTRIDCDKLFGIRDVIMEDSLKLGTHCKVSENLMNDIETVLKASRPEVIQMDREEVRRINFGVELK